jgi:serine/threonine protein kinase/WD40 repeat protein
MGTTACVYRARLEELLNSTLDEADQSALVAHLDTCASCQQQLEQLNGSQRAWVEAIRRAQEASFDTALQRVMDDCLVAEPWTRTTDTPPADDRVLLGFLGATERTDSLGRLDHYDVTEVIGCGGMGVVLKAFDPTLNRYVAIKVLAPQLATSAAARARFAREARAAAAVNHEHVVAIHAVSEWGGLPYLVMEYVPGLSLQQRLDQDGPLELEEILRIGMQVASGLAAAHAQGLIHRDIKPANILLENGVERIKITDFGLARTMDDASLTQSGVLAGTPHYMAPEQARGEPLDCRADLFSLGSVLYALCSGRPPFRAGTVPAVLRRVSEEMPRPLHEVNPRTPTWLARVIARLHAPDPRDRFSSAAEVAELLGRCLAHVQQPALVPLPAGAARPPLAWARGLVRTYLRTVVAAFCVATLGLLAWWWLDEPHSLRHVLSRVLSGGEAGQAVLSVNIEVPQVQVSIRDKNDEEVALLESPGSHRLSLPAGQYQLQATKYNLGIISERITLRPNELREPSITKEAIDRQHAIVLPHQSIMWHAAFSPDGKTLATGGGGTGSGGISQGRLTLWDLPTRRRTDLTEEGGVRAVAFSPDGALLATGSFNHKVQLRDPRTGATLCVLGTHGDGVNAVSFRPDGKVLASGALDGTITLWNLETRCAIRSFQAHQDKLYTVIFAPDGKTLISGGTDYMVRVWDANTGSQRFELQGHTNCVEYVAVGPDGHTLASAGWDGRVILWDLHTGKRLNCYQDPTCALGQELANSALSLAFSPSGRHLLIGWSDGAVSLWNWSTSFLESQVQLHKDKVYGITWAPNGHLLATASHDGTVQLWLNDDPTQEIRTNPLGPLVPSWRGRSPAVTPPAGEQGPAPAPRSTSQFSTAEISKLAGPPGNELLSSGGEQAVWPIAQR